MTFLDFGLVKRYKPDEVALFESLIRTFVVEHDIAAFRRVLEDERRAAADAPISDDDVARVLRALLRVRAWTTASLTFSPSTRRRRVRADVRPSSPYAHVAKASNVPPAFVITQRINLGLHAVLGRLRATANLRRIADELWPFVDGPPSTPMGEAEAAWLASDRHST